MELNEFKILQWQSGTNNHSITITRTCMCGCAAEVSTTISTSGQNCLMSPETMQCAVLHVHGNDTNAFAVLHDQVHSEVLNEEVGVMTQRLTIESVQESVTCTIGSGSASVGLTSFSVLQRLTAKGTLVDLAFWCS